MKVHAVDEKGTLWMARKMLKYYALGTTCVESVSTPEGCNHCQIWQVYGAITALMVDKDYLEDVNGELLIRETWQDQLKGGKKDGT